MDAGKLLKMHIPSRLGSEKAAMHRAAEIARHMGFSKPRIEDLKTAVAEACINAIEHSHSIDGIKDVVVTLSQEGSRLKVTVRDNGVSDDKKRDKPEDIFEDRMKTGRGWGLYLMQELMDEVKFEVADDGGGLVKMVMDMEK